ncbi:hypothetical protein F3K34_44030 [Streptomyces sp. LBUM 1486]|uniref:hypothetical protein n=1 Tax=Streptomyces scabiei TaxID=1930 RepID=UPI001B31E63B|nr:hypothetical protein [Streptomyces sp. LBUM 1486]MBP5918757.1 hypothetical protein [Streptomyces sp. LBUM 1486]
MADHEQQPSQQEMAALALYHQLVNLSPDDGDNALMVTLRLPNGRYVGDVWLSAHDVQCLTDASMGMGLVRAATEQHLENAAFNEAEAPAAPLPIDDHVTDEEVTDVINGLVSLLKAEGDA